ncbi:MAG: flavodoxin [Clostridia bacterium]|nr:flavodoxin [Clostridia bacterium]
MNLIAFYSRAAENYSKGAFVVLKKGNTEVIAEYIKTYVGGDMFKIEQEMPYSDSYNECIDQALKDQKANARPNILNAPQNIDAYDTVYLGFPNYWGTVPMAVMTFLECYDFSGKTIVPFCTHEGSGFGSSVKDIRKLCPAANVEDGLSIVGSNVDSARSVTQAFLKNR